MFFNHLLSIIDTQNTLRSQHNNKKVIVDKVDFSLISIIKKIPIAQAC